MKNADSTITAFVVRDDAKMSHLTNMFGKKTIDGWPAYVYGEKCVYCIMRKANQGYEDNQWTYARTTNGGFFMYPEGKSFIDTFRHYNGPECKMSTQAAGLAVSILAIRLVAGLSSNDAAWASYSLLVKYAAIHEENTVLLPFLDSFLP